jgi:chromosome segregation ATPase
METYQLQSLEPPESLGAARDGAAQQVEHCRTRRQNLETELAERIDSIAAELAKQLDAEGADASAVAELAREQAMQEAQVREQQLAAERDQALAELALRDAMVAELQNQLAAGEAATSDATTQLAERVEQLEQERSQFENDRSQFDSLRADLQQQVADLQNERNELSGRCDMLESQCRESTEQVAQQSAISDQLAAERDAHQAELAEVAARHEQVVAELTTRMAALEAELAESRDRSGATVADRDSLAAELANASESLALVQQQNADLTARIDSLTAELEQAAAAVQPVEPLRDQCHQLSAELQAADQRNAQLTAELTTLGELQQRALNDLELLSSERAKLSAQIESLQGELSQASSVPSAQADQRVAELEQRLAMTIDDLKALRDENNELKNQLASVSATGPAVDLGEGDDWESQKRRLLASLEGEGDVPPPRRQEQLAIEQVIAATDRTIAELRQQLASVPAPPLPQPDNQANQQPLASEACDADEQIRAQRAHLAELEAEMQEKLKQGELELSLARAKVAREQAELADWRIELETLAEQLAAKSGGGERPRRRWLDQLGLGGEPGDSRKK